MFSIPSPLGLDACFVVYVGIIVRFCHVVHAYVVSYVGVVGFHKGSTWLTLRDILGGQENKCFPGSRGPPISPRAVPFSIWLPSGQGLNHDFWVLVTVHVVFWLQEGFWVHKKCANQDFGFPCNFTLNFRIKHQ